MSEIKQKSSLFLGAYPSFLEGMARIFDFSGTMTQHNASTSPTEADVRALRHDWELLKSDMGFAVGSVVGAHE